MNYAAYINQLGVCETIPWVLYYGVITTMLLDLKSSPLTTAPWIDIHKD